MREQEAYLKLETTAEISLGKEINLVNKHDFNHLDLVIEAKNNRLKSEFFYIYDYEKFNNCSLLKDNFNIFKVKNSINHTSSRIVIHYLTKELKKRYQEFKKNESGSKHSLTEIFKPSLNQFNDSDIVLANDFIRSMFPFEGCSYTGTKLEEIIRPVRFLTLVLALRIIWSLLPGAIIPWKSFKDFYQHDETSNKFMNYQSFYDDLPKFLPSYNHSCILFEFLEIFLSIFKNDYFLDLNSSIDLIFTAGQICFNRDEYKSQNEHSDDLPELHKFYHKRGSSFYIIFIAYLRSLSKEVNSTSPIEFKNLFDFFKINQYPPLEHKPLSQRALTLTVPAIIDGDGNDKDSNEVNYFRLISNASNSTSRIYSSNHSFTKFENKFLDKFEVNPHKMIDNFFSKSSKNYLLKFDNTLNFDDFKINDDISNMRSNLKKNATLFENKEFVSTFINEFNRYGFESSSGDLKNNNSDTFLNDTINFNFSSNFETIDKLPVRVSKLEITEWFINSWKYETFLGFLTNTIVVKLTKTIGDCDWLIISSNDKISTNNRYLTPDEAVDAQKEKELGGSLKNEPLDPAEIKRPTTPKKLISAKQKRKSPNSKDLKRISNPSKPNNISNFEREFNAQTEGFDILTSNNLSSNNGKSLKKKLEISNSATTDKPLPPPVIPKQRLTTPQSQIVEGFADYDTPSGSTRNAFLPPPLVRNTVNDNSLISNNFDNGFNFNEHSELQAIINELDENEKPELNRSNSKLLSAVGNVLQKPFSNSAKSKGASSHPYQQLKSTPPRTKEEEEMFTTAAPVSGLNDKIAEQSLDLHKLKEIESPATISTLTENKPVVEPFKQDSVIISESVPNLEQQIPEVPKTLRSKSTSHFETPNQSTEKFPGGSIRKLSSLSISSPSAKVIKTTIHSATTPIHSFPKFSFLSTKKDRTNKVSPSESNNSLSFINDGTGLNYDITPLPSTEKPVRSTQGLKVLTSSASEIPDIPNTPNAIRAGSFLSSANPDSLSSMVSHNSNAHSGLSGRSLDDAISLNRESFISNSPISSKQKFDFKTSNLHITDDDDTRATDADECSIISKTVSEDAGSILTADTTKNSAKWKSHSTLQSFKGLNTDLDGLMKDIKDTINPNEFHSSEEISK